MDLQQEGIFMMDKQEVKMMKKGIWRMDQFEHFDGLYKIYGNNMVDDGTCGLTVEQEDKFVVISSLGQYLSCMLCRDMERNVNRHNSSVHWSGKKPDKRVAEGC